MGEISWILSRYRHAFHALLLERIYTSSIHFVLAHNVPPYMLCVGQWREVLLRLVV